MQHTRVILAGLVAAVILFAGGSPAFAQAGATGQISGTVSDVSGGVLPGVDVTATQTDTGFKRSTVTDANGLYTLPSLPTGPYRLDVTLSGFRSVTRTGITLQVNSNLVIPVVLSLGELTETVTVVGEAPLVETRNLGVGQVMDNERIMELPLNGRNTADLLQYAPAAVPQPSMNAGGRSFGGSQGGLGYSIAGGLANAVTYVLDGASHNNPYDNLNLPLPFPDAMQEFRVETSALTAQNGMHTGAAVNGVTKSGTNQLHGTAFEFLRDKSMNASNPFNARQADGSRVDDGLNRNQYGGTVGGPILADRLFYFAGYQGTRTKQRPSDLRAFVPTAQMLAGDFTAFASPACNNGRQLNLAAPFAGNQINPNLFSPAARNIASKLPTTSDPCGLYQYSVQTITDEAQTIGKVDYQLNTRQSLFGRYMATSFFREPPVISQSDNILTSATAGNDDLAQSLAGGHNWVFGDALVNSFRVTFNRTAVHRTNGEYFGPNDVGVNMYTYLPKFLVLSVTNGFSIGGGTSTDATFITNSYQVGNDVTLVRGTHQFAVGGSVAHWDSDSVANVRAGGNLTINGSVTGSGLSDFLLGRLTQLQQSAPNTLFMKQTYFALYGQDTWRVSPRITLNYGLRWEPFIPQQLTENQIYNFDLTRFQQGVRSTVYRNAPPGLHYPGDSGFPSQAGMNTSWGNVGPRVGLAWDPRGDSRMAVRASYARSFDFVSGGFHINTANAPPWGNEIRVASPGGGLDNPFVGTDQPNIFPTQLASPDVPFTPFGAYLSTNYDMATPEVHQWHLSVERQLGTSWLVSAGYLGNRVTNLWETEPLNNADPSVTTAVIGGTRTTCVPGAANFQTCMTQIQNQRRPFYLANSVVGEFFGPVDRYVTDGTQHYNGMVLHISRRAGRGATVSANYTLSKCYGSPPGNGGTASPNLGTGYNNPNDHGFDDGNCDTDRRHVFTMTAGISSPQMSGNVLKVVASDWRLAGSFRALSGPFMHVSPGSDRALNAQTGTQRVNQVSDEPYADRSINPANNGMRYLDPAAFAQPALGTLGTMKRNSIEGIGSRNVDLSISRAFRVATDARIEVRAEAFNALNWFQWNQPNTTLSSPIFGQITSAGDPRIIQLAAKFMF